MQTKIDFRQQLARGREYEVAFSRWLQAERGYYTLPVFDFNGIGSNVAPHIQRGEERLVVPDILANKDGVWAWFEVKLKERADWHRKTKALVTGLPLRNWQHYLSVQKATQTPVFLVFIHLTEGEVIAEDIRTLSYHHIHHAATMDSGGTVFFEYSRLRRVVSLDGLNKYKGD